MTKLAALTLNGGSSTVKYGLFTLEAEPREIARTSIGDLRTATMPTLWQRIGSDARGLEIAAVGHRIVHGGTRYVNPQLVTADVVANLRSLIPFAPNHLPQEIALLEASMKAYPDATHCACFDTAFHAEMPEIARRMPLPAEYASRGIQKYGFHGLSYAFLVEELRRIADRETADGRVIFAHLGSGSSLAAVKHGRPIDTTMGLTPLGGVMMGTRTGDLDPGVVAYLARTSGLAPDALEELLANSSGLLGVSGSTSDMKTLLAREPSDAACRLAIEMYVYSVAKAASALCAALAGVDSVVFSGGIGEHAASIRARILERLAWLGIDVDREANEANHPVISSPESHVVVRVIPTDEELMIARSTVRLVKAQHADRS